MTKFAALFAFLLLSACATVHKMDSLTAEEKAYLDTAMKTSPTFEVEKEIAEEAWSRGHSFINQFSGMKIQSSTDYHVSTFDPNVSETGTTGYVINKELKGKKVKFTVRCLTKSLNFKYTPEMCRNNEKLMSHFMQSGELQEKFVDSKFAETGHEAKQ